MEKPKSGRTIHRLPRFWNAHEGQIAILSDYPLPCVIDTVGTMVDGKRYIGVSCIRSIFEEGRSFDMDGKDFHSESRILSIIDMDKEFIRRTEFLTERIDHVLELATPPDPKGPPEPAKEPEIVAHKQHANCLVSGKEIEGLLDGHATVSIKRYSISSLYESTYSHYCGKCFLELGFDATERELRNRQQPIAETEPEQPKYKVGDWVEYRLDGDTYYGKICNIHGYVYYLSVTTEEIPKDQARAIMLESIIRKLSPFEVIVHIGCLSGTVRQCGDKEEEVFALCTNHNAAVIPFTMCDPATRSLVESILRAQEEEK